MLYFRTLVSHPGPSSEDRVNPSQTPGQGTHFYKVHCIPPISMLYLCILYLNFLTQKSVTEQRGKERSLVSFEILLLLLQNKAHFSLARIQIYTHRAEADACTNAGLPVWNNHSDLKLQLAFPPSLEDLKSKGHLLLPYKRLALLRYHILPWSKDILQESTLILHLSPESYPEEQSSYGTCSYCPGACHEPRNLQIPNTCLLLDGI